MSLTDATPTPDTTERTDVVVLRWPEQRHEFERLAARSIPALLLIEAGTPPPNTGSCLADWVRVPADAADVAARRDALVQRASHHPSRPVLDDYGRLSYRGHDVYLSPTDERVARLLCGEFDGVVTEEQLLGAAWPEGGSAAQLRVHVSRLRKRVAHLGLDITAIRGHGYRMHERQIVVT